MKIVIIGANGQVGKELSMIFHTGEHQTTAVVRNPFAAAFFELNQIQFVLSDVTCDDFAKDALQSADLIVIAAVARGDFETALRINKSILSGVTSKAGKDSSVIFFSSIRIFSRQIDRQLNWYEPRPAYDREKAASEKVFLNLCQKYNIRGHVFRLGHVIGPGQAKNAKFEDALKNTSNFRVQANNPSNTVLTQTLADALLHVASNPNAPKISTVVNQPQWTWKQLFDYIDPDQTPNFTGDSPHAHELNSKKIIAKILFILQPIKKWLKQYKRHLRPDLAYSVYCQGRSSEIKQDLAILNGEEIELSEFAYRPAPGPFIDSRD